MLTTVRQMFVSEILEQITAAVCLIFSMSNHANARIENLLAIMTQIFEAPNSTSKKALRGKSDVQVEASVTN